MQIIKRNGQVVDFDQNKIVNAIQKANQEVPESARLSERWIQAITEDVVEMCEERYETVSVEEVQDMVQNSLIKHGAALVASKYITYRFTRALARKANTTDDEILSLIELANEEAKDENSNKNPTLAPTQRDYMAGAVSKDLTNRILLPKDIVDAHKAGIIHFHDADYFAQHIHNCFTGGTRFVTANGIRQFRDFHDGDIVTVKDKDGVLREATVHKYGQQKMQKVELYNNNMTRQVICTKNHRWILVDGSVTTELKEGDVLYPLQDSTDYSIESVDDAKAFCMGFIVGDGTDTKQDATQIRLCGEKAKYLPVFEKAGYHQQKSNDGDVYLYKRCAAKQDFLNGKAWRFMTARHQALVFAGYYAADGNTNMNRVATADERICLMIEETSALAGYHITSSTESVRDTEYKKDSKLYYYYFMTHQSRDTAYWRVRSITPDKHGEVDAWCVEEPVTHSFTLEGGVITGNCDVWNLEDMLQNGTVISNTLIEKPHSFYTACNITTQIVAQVASSQYGGQTFTLAHLVPFVEISRQKLRKDVRAEIEEVGAEVAEELINTLAEKRLKKEIASGVQTIQYQLVTLMTTNG